MYMIFVKGGRHPNVIHDIYAKAMEEADRLAHLPATMGKTIYITEIRETVTPVVSVCRESYKKDDNKSLV